MTDKETENIKETLREELLAKYKDSEALRCFIELEIQRTILSEKNNFESLKKVAKIVKDQIMKEQKTKK